MKSSYEGYKKTLASIGKNVLLGAVSEATVLSEGSSFTCGCVPIRLWRSLLFPRT